MNPENISRRKFLQFSFAAAGFMAASPENTCRVLERIPVKSCTKDTVTQIKEFEFNQKYKPLDFYQARDAYLPLIFKLLEESAPTLKKQDEFLDSTFILRGSLITAEDKFGGIGEFIESFLKEPLTDTVARPLFVNLSKDYPALLLGTEAEIKQLGMAALFATGAKLNSRIFLFLDTSNNQPKTVTLRKDGQAITQAVTPNWLYRGPGPQTECFEFKPAANFRSVAIHEGIHFDNADQAFELSGEILSSCQRVTGGMEELQELALTSGQKSSFIVSLFFKNEAGEDLQAHLTGLEEFATDYLSSSVSIMNNLTYTLAFYGRPNDYDNFTKIIKQSELTIDSTYQMHRDSKVEKLLTVIAGEFVNPGGAFKEELLDVVVKNLLVEMEGFSRSPWKAPFPTDALKEYYPYLDSNLYEYTDPVFFKPKKGSKAGCVLKI